MADSKKIELFENMPIPKAVAKLAIPTLISSLVMVLYNLADTMFVGQINDPVQNAAVTLAAPVLLAFNAVVNLFGTGCSSLMSRALGKKDYETVKKTAAFGFYSALFLSLVYSFLCFALKKPLFHLLGGTEDTFEATQNYLFWTVICGAAPSILNIVLSNMIRSEGASLNASIGVMSGCLLNVALDPVFILPWGLGMGAAGAGLATFISNCVACAYYFVLLWVKRRSTFVCLNPRMFSFDREIMRESFSVGVPAAVQNLLNVTGMTVLNNFTSPFGSEALSAMGITHRVNMVPMYISMGFGQGIMPLIGYNYASGDGRRMKKAILFTAKLTVSFVLPATALCYIFSGFLISLFMKNPEIIAYGTRFLRGFCLGLPFLGVDFLAVGIFQAVGMGRESFIFAVLRKVALEIPALYVLNRIYPLYGLAYSQLIAEAVLCVAAVFVLRKLFRRVAD